MNSGQILNGLGGMLAQAAGPFVSNTWFPPEERTTATALATLTSQLGLALSYIIGPLIVEEASPLTIDPNLITAMQHQLSSLMYMELGVTSAILLMSLGYFPNKPKQPPSNSASFPKLDFRGGFKKLVQEKDFWLILVIAASSAGIYSGWTAVLFVNLKDHQLDITQVRRSVV